MISSKLASYLPSAPVSVSDPFKMHLHDDWLGFSTQSNERGDGLGGRSILPRQLYILLAYQSD